MDALHYRANKVYDNGNTHIMIDQLILSNAKDIICLVSNYRHMECIVDDLLKDKPKGKFNSQRMHFYNGEQRIMFYPKDSASDRIAGHRVDEIYVF
mgnify:CR=1 FL=1